MSSIVHLIITVILFGSSIYLLFLNRRLAHLKIDEELEQLDVEAKQIETKYKNLWREKQEDFYNRGFDLVKTSITGEVKANLEKKKQLELDKIRIRGKFLEKLKKIRWLFSKIG